MRPESVGRVRKAPRGSPSPEGYSSLPSAGGTAYVPGSQGIGWHPHWESTATGGALPSPLRTTAAFAVAVAVKIQTGRSVRYRACMSAGQPARAHGARPAPRRGRPGYDLESLLAVAVSVFNERGYDGTSMDDLSRRLGIAKSSIYHHVDSKEELLALALDRALDGLFSVADEVSAGSAPAIERLEQLVRGSVHVLADRLAYVTLLLRARGNTGTERKALARRREFDQIVADLVKQAERDGDIRPDIDPAITARLLFGMVNSLIEWYRPGGRSAHTGPDALADAVCAVAFDGLRIRRSPPQQP
jgi:AcrR family transcriptional regulator